MVRSHQIQAVTQRTTEANGLSALTAARSQLELTSFIRPIQKNTPMVSLAVTHSFMHVLATHQAVKSSRPAPLERTGFTSML